MSLNIRFLLSCLISFMQRSSSRRSRRTPTSMYLVWMKLCTGSRWVPSRRSLSGRTSTCSASGFATRRLSVWPVYQLVNILSFVLVHSTSHYYSTHLRLAFAFVEEKVVHVRGEKSRADDSHFTDKAVRGILRFLYCMYTVCTLHTVYSAVYIKKILYDYMNKRVL